MANIVVISTPTNIEITFNDLSTLPQINAIGATFKRSELIEVWHNTEPIEHLRLLMDSGREWSLNIVGGENIMPVTTVDGSTSTDMEDLHTLIKALFI